MTMLQAFEYAVRPTCQECHRRNGGNGRHKLCFLQVMAKVAGERALPPHNLAATAANDAYVLSSIVNKAGLRHLDVGYLRKAMADKENLATLRAGHRHARKCDAFVDFVLGLSPVSMEGGDMEAACQESASWLALYSICSKLMKIRPGTKIESELPELELGALCAHRAHQLHVTVATRRRCAHQSCACTDATYRSCAHIPDMPFIGNAQVRSYHMIGALTPLCSRSLYCSCGPCTLHSASTGPTSITSSLHLHWSWQQRCLC